MKKPPGVKRNKIPFVGMVLAFLFTASLVTAYFSYWRVSYKPQNVCKDKDRIQKRLDADNNIPVDENGWYDLDVALQYFVPPNKMQNNKALNKVPPLLFDATTLYSTEDWKNREIILGEMAKANKKCIESLEKSLSRKYFIPPSRYWKHFESEHIDVTKISSMIEWMNLLALHRATHGDVDGCARLLLANLRICQGISHNQHMGVYTKIQTIKTYVLDELRKIVNRDECKPKTQRMISREMWRIRQERQTLKDMVGTHFLFAEYLYDDLGKGKISKSIFGGQIPGSSISLPKLAERERRIYRKWYKDTMKMLDGNQMSINMKFSKVEEILEKHYVSSQGLDPDLKDVYECYCFNQAKSDGIMLLAALKCYKADKGRYPKKLARLYPFYIRRIPRDPFSIFGEVEYHKSGDVILLYSFGNDWEDDLAYYEQKTYDEEGDIIITDNDPPMFVMDIFGYIRCGDLEEVEALLKKNPELLSKRNDDGDTPLLYSIKCGQNEIIDYLVSRKADLKTRDKKGITTLMIAMDLNDEDLCRKLLNYEPDLINDVGEFSYCTWENNVEKMKQLLKKDPSLLNKKDCSGRTPLHYASLGVCPEATYFLVTNGADVNARDSYGITPLQFWTLKKNTKMVKLLLKHSAKGDIKKMVKLLLKHSAKGDIKNGEGHSALSIAAGLGYTEAVKLLIKNQANVNVRDKINFTPLHNAVEKGHRDVVELLIKHGADVNAMDKERDSPLELAILTGNEVLARILIENGADVNHKNSEGYPLLHLAMRRGMFKTAKLLIRKGAECKSKGPDGYTPMDHAVFQDRVEIIEVLIKKGADIKAIDKDGRSYLHKAAMTGSGKVIKTLLKKGLDVNLKDRKGKTARDLARERGWEKAVKLLKVKVTRD